ncbi:hypothetical protein H0H81_003732 [Sphagnurus paluster]|uniref:PEHE domain-containing protein n=1 Tax=Sphagnurus paluster TaxID=117069 RepID=A0A9P7FUT1_9AGAR|nr:hypothetical protein H0H81_003732 [Sphagnurus paluster]
MDAPSTSSNTGTQARQKRVMPSRSARRGGPGVGNCDADVMILDTQRRKFENEPLIPEDTPFLLTTNPALASTSSSTLEVNIHANDRYFERPDVLKAYREQSIIQTPEYVSLGDTPVGRLRARSQAGITEDGPLETSDAAYEKRHRKYETFEKRQRLREKEKLKHEQYKLKERIEQLRAMDPAAFLTLPDNLFPESPHHADPESEPEEGLSPQHNGGPNREGERRRKEMLSVAYMLEDRYRVLLPPDRVRKSTSQIAADNSIESEAPVYSGRDRHVSEPEESPTPETEADSIKLKLKLAARPSNPTVPVSAANSISKKRRQSALPPLKQPPTRKAKPSREELQEKPRDLLRQDIEDEFQLELHDELDERHDKLPQEDTKLTPHTETQGLQEELVEEPHIQALVEPSVEHQHLMRASSPPMNVYPPHMNSPSSSPKQFSFPEPPSISQAPNPESRSTTPMSNPGIAVLEPVSPKAEAVICENEQWTSALSDHTESTSALRPQKRVKRSPSLSSNSRHATRESSLPPIESIPATFIRSSSHASTVISTVQSSKQTNTRGPKRKQKLGLLVALATRNQGSKRNATARQKTVWGGALPPDELEMKNDFVLPAWINPPEKPGPECPGYYEKVREQSVPGVRTILNAAEFSRNSTHPPAEEIAVETHS